MMKVFAIIAILFAITYCLPLSDLEARQWNDFKIKHGKTYATAEEENLRQNIFFQNLKEFEEHNAKYEAGLVSYTKGVNQFSDMTKEEFVSFLTPFNLSEIPVPKNVYFPSTDVEQAEVDWREKGAVTPIKQQGGCGAAWSGSATGALEGQFFIKKGQLISLSQQNLIDCSQSAGNKGCNGWPSKAFDYVHQNGGIDTESSYPYEGAVGPCRYNPQNSAGTADGAQAVQPSEDALKRAVANVGPISVAINAEGIGSYMGGIYDDPNCDAQKVNYPVLVVGYGSENGADYWIVKNSWGPVFGEDGYIRMARNKENQCGIASQATYPVVSATVEILDS